ncbi:hypothetical protein ILUMI_02882 [Ignelater luminosus]|uniref:Retroviral polymerase SH3-like domain-containing protein n=1 Tax=Ignelater luminosus TaxID=2038154 RepID=A0A8K0DHE7_IGNLU|nr:hypothetical protein ILUMI_02882 [Ignelater luminosus]
MSKSYWEEAVLTAKYITNRTQSSLIKNRTPYELWLKKKPNVSNMRVFGCTAYARIPDSLRTKLDDKGVKCRFIGYAENGYRLLNETENKIIHSRNVIFNEDSFCIVKGNRKENKLFEDENENIKESKDDERNDVEEKDTDSEADVDGVKEDDARPKKSIKLPLHFQDYEIDLGCLALLSNFCNVPKSCA